LVEFISAWYLEAVQLLFIAYYQVEVIIIIVLKGKKSFMIGWDNFGKTNCFILP